MRIVAVMIDSGIKYIMTLNSKDFIGAELELITAFPPRPIDTELEYAATQTQINKILDKGELNSDDRAYLKILGLTIYDYEEQTESF